MQGNKIKLLVIFILIYVMGTFGAPTDSNKSFVVSSTESLKNLEKENHPSEALSSVPQIYQMHVQSNISNRFAYTTVISKVRNAGQKSQEAVFSIVLPESAFISGFIMEIGGKNYTAYVKDKDEAKKEYDKAVAEGLGAAHVAVSARDSNRFTVSVNVEPETKAAFYLIYEELLQRHDGRYEQIINLHPGQPVKDLSVEVLITESRRIVDLKAPPLRSGNEIDGNDNTALDPRADLQIVDNNTAIVKFRPNLERQKQLAHLLGKNESEGLAGQFVVQYDVERDPHGGEVLIQDGYFVHFFAPADLAPLPKHVVFVLDTSSSMWGDKIEQLKKAMDNILEQLHDKDLFSLVEFNTNVKVWDLDNENSSVWYPFKADEDVFLDREDIGHLAGVKFPNAYLVTPEYIKKAKETVSKFDVTGATDIFSALNVALHLVGLANNKKVDKVNRQSIVMFLTDGEPTVRLRDTQEIANKISELNNGLKRAPIFALSFGDGADKDFLKKLAFRNSGFSKHIYEAADAALQLQGFYKHISSPLLANVTFQYEPSVTSLTKTKFALLFDGSELVVSGRYDKRNIPSPVIDGWGANGDILLKPIKVVQSISNIERLWAYLTIKQLLEFKEVADVHVDMIKEKALDLALKYSFVTPVSSLVVVKPNATNAVDTEAASQVSPEEIEDYDYGGDRIFGGGSHTVDKMQSSGQSSQQNLTISSTPSSTTASNEDEQSGVVNLLTELPWLKDILNSNGTLNLPSGNFKLGLNGTVSDKATCPKTPLNTVGHCSLLHACPQIHSLLTDSHIFIQHSCVLRDEYAGVCCPNIS